MAGIGRVDKIRIYKATKVIVASKLSAFKAGLTGPDIISVQGSGESSYPWRFVIKGITDSPHAQVDRENIDRVDVNSEFIVTELINLIDPTITHDQLHNIETPESEPLRIWFTVRL